MPFVHKFDLSELVFSPAKWDSGESNTYSFYFIKLLQGQICLPSIRFC